MVKNSEIQNSPNPACAVTHCDIEATSRVEGSLCSAHYQLRYRGLDPETRSVRRDDSSRVDKVCWVESCGRRAVQKNLCSAHASSARCGLIEVPNEFGIKLNPPCSVEWCKKLSDSTKILYCSHHRQEMKKYGHIPERRDWGVYTSEDVPCRAPGCVKHAISMGLCGTHSRRRAKYGLTTEEFLVWIDVQECQNPGCGNTIDLKIDHDHVTGAVRGMLCNGCNTGLGLLGEDVERIAGLIEYKKLHG